MRRSDEARAAAGNMLHGLVDELLAQREFSVREWRQLSRNRADVSEQLNSLLFELSRLPNRTRSVERESRFEYPPEYKGAKPVADQVAVLRDLFPGLTTYDARAVGRPLPRLAEGLFVVPYWPHLAEEYFMAARVAWSTLAKTRACKGSLELEFKMTLTEKMEETTRKREALRRLWEEQAKSDFLLIPAQFGRLHRGQDTIRATELLTVHEFGLGVFEVVSMLLTHPEREMRWDRQLHPDCLGDVHKDGAYHRGEAAHFGSYSIYTTPQHKGETEVDSLIICSTTVARNVYAASYGSVTGFLKRPLKV